MGGCTHQDWRTTNRSSAGLAPLPEEEPAAVVQVYAARAFAWRGYFAVHCWIATKEKDSDHYVTYQVTEFQMRRTGGVVAVSPGIPDQRWYGSEPDLIVTMTGERAAQAIPKIAAAASSYPYQTSYRIWPGPNSNTFVSYILRKVPEIGVELPPHAIGKDWINEGNLFGITESGTGVQFSLFGLLGLTLGLGDGIEVDLLGMSFGLDFWRPALKLPFIGRLGFRDAPVFD